VLVAAPVAWAGDEQVLAARRTLFPAASRPFAASPDGWQARYDAGRNLLEAVRGQTVHSPSCTRLKAALLAFGEAQVAIAERADYPVRRPGRRLPFVPATCSPRRGPSELITPGFVGSGILRAEVATAPERTTDAALAAKLAAIGVAFHGWAGLWVHDLRSGRTAGWNSDAVFPAGSTVKLGALAAAVRRYGWKDTSPVYYDLEQVAAWSSNLAANRLVGLTGLTAVNDALRRLGMWSSTYPGAYRVGTSARVDAPKPPPRTHTRVTTAHDLGRALYRLWAASLGHRLAIRQSGLDATQASLLVGLLRESLPLGLNRGLLRPWLPRARMVQKHAWLSDLRTTAAIVGTRDGATIVVVEAYRPGITTGEARALGRNVVRAVALDRRTR
jgi:hypothetical protein